MSDGTMPIVTLAFDQSPRDLDLGATPEKMKLNSFYNTPIPSPQSSPTQLSSFDNTQLPTVMTTLDKSSSFELNDLVPDDRSDRGPETTKRTKDASTGPIEIQAQQDLDMDTSKAETSINASNDMQESSKVSKPRIGTLDPDDLLSDADDIALVTPTWFFSSITIAFSTN
jgi:hypothetical protein